MSTCSYGMQLWLWRPYLYGSTWLSRHDIIAHWTCRKIPINQSTWLYCYLAPYICSNTLITYFHHCSECQLQKSETTHTRWGGTWWSPAGDDAHSEATGARLRISSVRVRTDGSNRVGDVEGPRQPQQSHVAEHTSTGDVEPRVDYDAVDGRHLDACDVLAVQVDGAGANCQRRRVETLRRVVEPARHTITYRHFYDRYLQFLQLRRPTCAARSKEHSSI